MQLGKPPNPGNLLLQDDHVRRMADISFRHLAESWKNYQEKQKYIWVREIDRDDHRWGKKEYLTAGVYFDSAESEEHTHAMGATVFSHVWLLSAANYYRLSNKGSDKDNILHGTDNPEKIAKELELPQHIQTMAKTLHLTRNTIMHLVELTPKTEPIHNLNFPTALLFAKLTWTIYCKLLRKYGVRPDVGSWRIQASKYELPHVFHSRA